MTMNYHEYLFLNIRGHSWSFVLKHPIDFMFILKFGIKVPDDFCFFYYPKLSNFPCLVWKNSNSLIRSFGRICHPGAFDIRIFNPKYRDTAKTMSVFFNYLDAD